MTLSLIVLAAALAACSDVDVPPGRGISEDIAAAHDTGPNSSAPGMLERREPQGVFPWDIGERR
jgi:hypothetical protein